MTESVPGTHSHAIIKDGRTYLVFPFTHSSSLKKIQAIHQQMLGLGLLEFSRLLKANLTEKQQAKIENADFRVWEEKPFLLDKDYFHEFVQKIFGNTEINKKFRPGKLHQVGAFIRDYIGLEGNKTPIQNSIDSRSLPPLNLTSHARNLISGRFGTRSDGLCIKLSKAAVKRLERSGFEPPATTIDGETVRYIRFDLEQANCLFFGTGVGMLVMQVEFLERIQKNTAVPVDFMLELNNLLCRADSHSAKSRRQAECFWYQDLAEAGAVPENEAGNKLSNDCLTRLRGLGHLASMLIGGVKDCGCASGTIKTIHWEKVPTFSAVKTSAFAEARERELTSIRLARKETSDYLPCPDSFSSAFYQPFDYLTHVASIEGGAMLVEVTDPAKTAIYVNNLVRNSSERAYLPLMLWALHEYLFLTELSKAAGGWVNFHKPREEDTLRLQDFRERIYNYRFHFRFAQASVITMHNDMYRLWRQTFELGKILEEIDKDVAEAESKLERIYSQKAQRRNERGKTVLALLLALTGAVISLPDWKGKTVSKLLPEYCNVDPKFFCNDFPLHIGLLGIGIASFLLLALYVLYKAIYSVCHLIRRRKVQGEIANFDSSTAKGDK